MKRSVSRAARALLAASFAAALGAAQAADVVGRYKYGMANDTYIPKANVVTPIPFDVIRFQDGPDISLTADGMFLVNTAGLYYIHLGLDWKGQAGLDRSMRMYGIRRKLAGDTSPPNLKDERLASVDVPGADSPRVARYEGEWAPGTVPLGGHVSTEITLNPIDLIAVGDVAQASLSTITDGKLGVAANTALQVNTRVIAKDKVRVVLYNPSISGGIAVPSGTLRVVAMATTQTMGESADAWNVLGTALFRLEAGDKIYIVGKNSGVKNDYIQASEGSTFVQFERF